MDQKSVPFNNSYWVDKDRLMAGEYPLARDPQNSFIRLEALFSHGIRSIVDLTEPGEIRRLAVHHPGYEDVVRQVSRKMNIEVTYFSMPVRDFDAPHRRFLADVLDMIDVSADAGRPVYVHCWAGIGRTGTVVGAYLVRHGHPADISLFDTIDDLRRYTATASMASPQSSVQRDLILSWAQGE